MEEKSLRITGTNTTFFNRITKTLTKMLIPTKIGINGMLITIKRNSLMKAYENYKKDTENYNKEELEKKYDEAYTVYLEALDKYVMDSIYKKVRNNTATDFEKDALSRYYEVTSLKEKEYMDYKYRKQKYLLELDKESIENLYQDVVESGLEIGKMKSKINTKDIILVSLFLRPFLLPSTISVSFSLRLMFLRRCFCC